MISAALAAVWEALEDVDVAAELEAAVNVASPTGAERPLAEHLAERLSDAGLEARTLPLSPTSESAVGRIPGGSGGPTLLLLAPIDSAWGPAGDEDVLGGRSDATDLPATRRGDEVVGLSAENPKAYVVAILAAARAMRAAGAPLRGTVAVGLAAGGMPVGPGPVLIGGEPFHPIDGQIGHGVGALSVVEAVRPDHAVIAKPGNAVSYEEAGLCWLLIRARGAFGYTGVRHLVPYRNAIVDAATIVAELERWFPRYTERHTAGLVAPQAAVGWIGAGWHQSPAFTPATCELLVDVRVAPGTPVEDVEREVAEAVARIAEQHGIPDVEASSVLGIPGSHTSPDAPIVRSAIRAWEEVHSTPHAFRRGTSGATDANVVRSLGVETARIGMPPPDGPTDRGFTMGLAHAEPIRVLARILTAVALDICGDGASRPRAGGTS